MSGRAFVLTSVQSNADNQGIGRAMDDGQKVGETCQKKSELGMDSTLYWGLEEDEQVANRASKQAAGRH